MQHRLQGLIAMVLHRLQKMSLIARVLSGVIVLFYGLSFIPSVEENLAMIPAYIGPPNVKIWTLVTATFYENSIIFTILDIIAVVGFSNVLEPLWSVREFLIFSCVVSVVSLISGVLISVVLYAIAQSYSFLFVPFHGLVSLACGYVVAVKQFHPDSVAFPPPAPPTLRVKHLPMVIIFISIIISAFHLVPYSFFCLAISGTLTSWVYLRFYQKREEGGRGDMAESFAFATFFPEPIQPPIASMGGFLYHILVKIKVCPKTVRTYDVSAPSTIRLTLPGTDPADAQRRKQRALKALDERLSKVDQPLTWPSLDDASSSQDELNSPNSRTEPKLEAVVIESTPSSKPQDSSTPSTTATTTASNTGNGTTTKPDSA